MDVSYGLGAAEVRRLSARAWVDGEQLVATDGTEFRLLVGGSDSLAGALGRVVEQEVFDADFGQHSPELMAKEYGPYEDQALFVTILDKDGPVAVDRCTWSPSISSPTKTEVDLGALGGELRVACGVSADGPVWDATTVAILPRARTFRQMLGWLVGEISVHCCLPTGAPYLGIIRHDFFKVLELWMPTTTALAGQAPFRYLEVWSQPTFAPAGAVLTMTGRFFSSMTAAAHSRLEAHGWSPDQLMALTPEERSAQSLLRV